MNLATTSLRIDDRVVARSEEGLLEVEYVLFDAADVEVKSAESSRGKREVGYATTAKEALARLSAAGVTVELAEKAARAFRPEAVDAYARGSVVRGVVSKLGAYELFEGRMFESWAQVYSGVWLDLHAFADDLNVPGVALALQALHLAAALAEVHDDASVVLVTESYTEHRGSAGRTFRDVRLDLAKELPDVIAALSPVSRRVREEPGEDMRFELAALVRERAMGGLRDTAMSHERALERALVGDPPREGLLADDELWSIDQQLAANDARGVDLRLDSLEIENGVTDATRYLRDYAAFVRGTEPRRRIAERLALRARLGHPEVDLLAARAWLAAGEPSYARHYARGLVEDATAPDPIRVIALEMLETTQKRAPTQPPPPVPVTARIAYEPVREPTPPAPPSAPVIVPTAPIVVLGEPPPDTHRDAPKTERIVHQVSASAIAVEAEVVDARSVPRGASRPPYASDKPRLGTTTEVFIPPDALVPRGMVTDAPPHAEPRIDRQEPDERPVRRTRAHPEPVETLPLPFGLDERELAAGIIPRTAREARIACTRLSRELARDYRLWYGTRLRTDALAIETMQRHLLARWPNGVADGPDAEWELRRHGALLSEILARSLGGEWVDVAPSETGYWAMFVPPRTRVWPFGRIHRFIAMGHRERDLVSYYLELDQRSRRG